jgi:tetratricopeptide (TPR) repeat protein
VEYSRFETRNLKKQLAFGTLLSFAAGITITSLSSRALASDNASSELESSLNAVYDQREDRKYDEALRSSNALVRKYPNSVAAQDLQTLLLMDKGKVNTEVFSKAIARPGKTAMDLFLISRLEEAEHNYDESMTAVTKAIELNPKNARFYVARSLLFSVQLDQKSAIADLNKALELDPKSAQAHRAKAFNARRAGNQTSALSEINQAIALSPQPDDYWLRATIYGSMKQTSLALKDWEHVLSIKQSAYGYSGRAALLLRCGKFKEGLVDLNKACLLEPDNYLAHRLRAEAYLAEKDPASANKDIQALHKYVDRLPLKNANRVSMPLLTMPEQTKLWQVCYEVHSQLGDWGAAKANLNQILKEFPGDQWALSRLSQATKLVGSNANPSHLNGDLNTKGTVDAREINDHKSPTHSKEQVDLASANDHLRRAKNFNRAMEVDKSLAEYAKAIAINPNLYEAYYDRGLIYREDLQFDKALVEFRKASTLTKDPIEALHRIVLIYMKQNKFDKAVEVCSEILKLDPDDGEALEHRSESNLLLGFAEKALSDIEKVMQKHPGVPRLLADRAQARMALHKDREAVDDLNQAVAIDPGKVEWLKLRAKAFDKCGEKKLAAIDREKIKASNQSLFEEFPFQAELRERKGKN